MNLKKNKIGILGGSFDPAHKGHLAISKEAVKRFKLKQIIWAITKKNPFKKQSVVYTTIMRESAWLGQTQDLSKPFCCLRFFLCCNDFLQIDYLFAQCFYR